MSQNLIYERGFRASLLLGRFFNEVTIGNSILGIALNKTGKVVIRDRWKKKEKKSVRHFLIRSTRDRISIESRFIRHCRNAERCKYCIYYILASVTEIGMERETNDIISSLTTIWQSLMESTPQSAALWIIFPRKFCAYAKWDVITFAFHTMNTRVQYSRSFARVKGGKLWADVDLIHSDKFVNLGDSKNVDWNFIDVST